MIRFIALTAVFFAVPFLAYALYILVTRRRLPQSGDWTLPVTLILCGFGVIFVLIGLFILVEDARKEAGPVTTTMVGQHLLP